MKVILNEDIKSLGEEGDVKNVAKGYFRNYLRPRRLAVEYNDVTAAKFEARRAEIEARKEQKRKASASEKERLEAITLEAVLSAGANGKLFGAVTAQTIAGLLAKAGFEVERKKIEIPGSSIKSVGNYHVTVKLYESESAQVKITVKAQEDTSAKAPERKPRREKADAAAKDKTAEEAKTAPDESSAPKDTAEE